jgi:hypothetical protein
LVLAVKASSVECVAGQANKGEREGASVSVIGRGPCAKLPSREVAVGPTNKRHPAYHIIMAVVSTPELCLCTC